MQEALWMFAMFEHFTEKAVTVIRLAQEEARSLGHNFIGTEQILLGLIKEETSIAAQVFKSLDITFKEVQLEVKRIIGQGSSFVNAEIPLTPRSRRVLELSLEEARQLGHNYVGPEHLLLSLLREGEGLAAKVLENLGVNRQKVRVILMQNLFEAKAIFSGNSSKYQKTSNLEECGVNLTYLASLDKLDPVVGRDKEVERTIQILTRRTKNNPILIGEPGVGKTAIAEELAQRIVKNNVPEILEGKRVLTLNVGALVAGTKYRGEFEERLKQIMEEIRTCGDIILVIDEVHTLVGAGAVQGSLDAANILKPALARGELQCIGITTLDEYRQIERDAALERRFQPVLIGEPSIEETILILQGLRSRYEKHHKLYISDLALAAAAKLSDRYIGDRFLPDKAIDLIDEAGSRVQIIYSKELSATKEFKQELHQVVVDKEDAVSKQEFDRAGELRKRELEMRSQMWEGSADRIAQISEFKDFLPVVNEEDIAHIVESWTGVPTQKLTATEAEQLLSMEDTLHQRLIGQEEAVESICRAIRRARVGLKNPNRPIASFIFAGPTGVGKTELVKSLAAYFFGSEAAAIRLDMSEYMERHTVSKLIGSPPGFIGYSEGGQLTEAVRRQPHTVVLFDEIEKAHPDVFNLLLQILEDGRLTDAKGRTVDFKNTLLVMTSNVGSKAIQKGASSLGFEFAEDGSYSRIAELVNRELKQYFRPEFLNRLDEILIFKQLTFDEVKQISNILLREFFSRLAEQNISLQVTERFQERLVEEGYNPELGARPLRRAISRLLEDSLAEEILSGRVKEGDNVVVDVDDRGQVQVLYADRK